MILRQIDQTDRGQVDAFIMKHWPAMQMVVQDERIDLGHADGFCAYEGNEIVSLTAYRHMDYRFSA